MKIGTINVDTVPISQVSMKGHLRTICPSPITFSVCPYCGEKLLDYTRAIPVSNTDCVKLFGLACHKCDTFFSNKSELIRLLDKERASQSAFRVCHDFDVPYDDVYYNSALSKLKSAVYQITACAPGKIQTYTIVTSKQDEDLCRYIFHYMDHTALELLTAMKLGEKSIRVGSDNLIIERVRNVNAEFMNGTFHMLSPSSCVEVDVKKNGGYYDLNGDVVQLHGLVFCESSKCYEVIAMSYNKDLDMYYVDSQVYRRFREMHGYPIVKYVSHSKGGLLELQEESLLHCLGYNVSSADGLSDAARHRMLASFVDLGFFDVHSIVRHLTFLINRNGKTRKNACEKWENDLAFIVDYRLDSDRFAFVSRIRRL